MVKFKNRVWRNLKWNKVKEFRGKYYTIYTPIRKIGVNYASLDLYFLSNFEKEEIARLMEMEMERWITNYQVPTIIFAIDKSDNDILLNNVRSGNLLFGYFDIESKNSVKKWVTFEEINNLEDISYITDKKLEEIYDGLEYETVDEVEKKLYKKYSIKYKQNKFLNIMFKSVLFIGIAFEMIVSNSFWLGLIFYIIEVIKFILKLLGYKTRKQKNEQKEINNMRYYRYHCEKNPVGFLKLKQENIEKENREKIKNESKKIKNQSSV